MGTSYLIVDDDERFRERLSRALRDRGLSVESVGDSRSALTALRRGIFERVILDLRLQGESGLTLLTDLLSQSPDLEVVVLTGYGSIATAVDALKRGALNYLSKPANVDRILAAFAETSSCEQESDVPSLSQVEWEHIQRVLVDCRGNISLAAKRLGVHRRSLQRKLARSH